jgi:hypothetical protein
MNKWIKCNDRLPDKDGKCSDIYIVMYDKYYPEFRGRKLIPELAVYDYYLPYDNLSWLSLKDYKWLDVVYWMPLLETPSDIDKETDKIMNKYAGALKNLADR